MAKWWILSHNAGVILKRDMVGASSRAWPGKRERAACQLWSMMIRGRCKGSGQVGAAVGSIDTSKETNAQERAGADEPLHSLQPR